MAYRMYSWDTVDPQNNSPLFNGHIPAEIRTLIFDFALTESVGPAWDRPVDHKFYHRQGHGRLDDDLTVETAAGNGEENERDHESDSNAGVAPAVQMPPLDFFRKSWDRASGWDWLRPGHTGQRKVHTALLQTCRRIYIETYELPPQNATKVFYGSNQPLFTPCNPADYVSQLLPEAAHHIRHVHIFSDTLWLQGGFFDSVTNMSALLHDDTDRRNPLFHPRGPSVASRTLHNPPQLLASPSNFLRRPWRVSEHLTSLRITIRRTDWTGWENNAPLAINPLLPGHDSALLHMQQAMRDALPADANLESQQRHSSPSRFEKWTSWGLLFLQMTSLKTLIIDFETTEDRRVEMEGIVHWAHQSWRFPVLEYLCGDSSDPFTKEQLRAHQHDTPVDLTPWSSRLRVLTAEDTEVKRSSWRGMLYHFATYCPSCNVHWYSGGSTPGCEACDKMTALLNSKKGPQLFVWTVTWTLKANQDDGDPLAAASAATGVRANLDNGEGSGNQSGSSNEASSGRVGGGPRSPNTESHILAMLSPEAQHRLRRARELEEILTTEVCF